jgi:cation diffusion facilitator CzcD-associated flavoprotein CzcO
VNPTSALPPVPPQPVASERRTDALAALAQQARADLARLNYPPANWVLPSESEAAPVLDVLVVGAGMCGQTAAYALRREGVASVRVIDAAPRGEEGPWGTYGRMPTLRSPKHLTGPDLGVPSLTFRAWYEAQHGAQGWESLHKVGRIDWRDYLLWVRDTIGIAVENGVRLVSLDDAGGLARATLRLADGSPQAVLARKVVLALGRDGSGGPRWPSFPSLVQGAPETAGRVFHSADAIDFAALAGKRVGVLGAGASAFDNAGTALEAGAQVVLFARRPVLPQVNKSKWTAFTGFLRGFEALDDARKWRFYTYIFDEQVPPPWESVRRCDDHPAFAMRLGEGWRDVRVADGTVIVETTRGTERFDAVIFGTGFDVDLLERPELAAHAALVDTWARHVTPEQASAQPDAAKFPYLGPGFELRSIDPARQAPLSRLHLFNWGATMSHGALAGDIPGLAIGATRLAQAIARDLFVADADRHWERLLAHEEAELLFTRRYVPPEERRSP